MIPCFPCLNRHDPRNTKAGRPAILTPLDDLTGTDKYINALCDWIDEQWALKRLMPGYINDPADVDKKGCFV